MKLFPWFTRKPKIEDYTGTPDFPYPPPIFASSEILAKLANNKFVMADKKTSFEKITSGEEKHFSKICKEVYGEACTFPMCDFSGCKCKIADHHHDHQERLGKSIDRSVSSTSS